MVRDWGDPKIEIWVFRPKFWVKLGFDLTHPHVFGGVEHFLFYKRFSQIAPSWSKFQGTQKSKFGFFAQNFGQNWVLTWHAPMFSGVLNIFCFINFSLRSLLITNIKVIIIIITTITSSPTTRTILRPVGFAAGKNDENWGKNKLRKKKEVSLDTYR